MNSPLVSVALCTFNGEAYLKTQLESLVHQTYPNLEIIAVDDASSDSTLTILQAYAKTYPHIKIFQNQTRLGFVKNFEKAIQLCTGDYIALCDQDDEWLLTKIERLVKEIGTHTLIYHNSLFVDHQGKAVGKKMSDRFRLQSLNDPRHLLLFNCISGHSLMFKKSLLTQFLPIQAVYHDWWIAYVAANVGTIGYLEECLVNYRQYKPNSTNVSPTKQLHKRIKVDLAEWLSQCDSFIKNKHPEFVSKLSHLYVQRKTFVFNWVLLDMLVKSKTQLFTIQRKSSLSKLFYVIKQFINRKALKNELNYRDCDEVQVT